MKVPFSTVAPLHKELREDILNVFTKIYDQNWFIGGEECSGFEAEFSEYCNANFCVGCSNGLDAIHLLLRAAGIGEGDEVIVPSNTFIATALAVSYTGAKPVLVEPNLATYVLDGTTIEEKITSRTKAVIAVHLYGQMADMIPIRKICDDYGLFLFEDAAQAHGAVYSKKSIGYYSHGATFSFYPGKNMGALGDAGAVITNDKELANRVRMLTNYGSTLRYHHEQIGYNCRLDTLQAGFLRAKLRVLDKINNNRQHIASMYLNEIHNDQIVLPVIGEDRTHVWHIFAIRTEKKQSLKAYLGDAGIQTVEHYPIAICDQKAYAEMEIGDQPVARLIASQELSIPLYYKMPIDEIQYVIDRLNSFK